VPFKSEKQRRYLWANEPEIARDWADTYGSRIQKKNGGITSSKTVKGQPHLLAYITPGEAKTLEKLGGQKTMTPEGIPAYPPGMGDPNYDGSGGGTYGGSGGNKKTSTNTGNDRREQYITDYVTTSKVKGGGEKIGPPGDKDIEYDDRDFKKPENKKIRDRQRDKYQRQWTSKGIAPPGPNRKKRQKSS